MNPRKSLSLISVGIFSIVLFSMITLYFVPKEKACAQTAIPPVQLYQSNPKTYSWTVNGKTYTNNKNPFGIEIYSCVNPDGSIDPPTQERHDTCIPAAKTINGNKYWPSNISVRSDTCNSAQPDYDSPKQSADTRTMNGTGKSDAQTQICTTTNGVQAPHPFINLTKQFDYNSSYCANGDAVTLAPRTDPSNPICTQLDLVDLLKNPWNYSTNQRSCLMFIDDVAYIQACKGSTCKTHTYINSEKFVQGIHPDPSTLYENLCDIFTQGSGTYNVNIKTYDSREVQYGNSSFWLTLLSYGIPHSINGHVFNDVNKNGKQDAGEPIYAGPITITSSAGTVTTSGGSYSITGIPSGTVTVSFPALPAGYELSYPKNGPPPSFSATVGPGCSVDGTTGATCNVGDIDNLNFAITNSFPWIQSTCGDIRNDNGITDLLPLGQTAIKTSVSCTNPGVGFSGDTTANFGQGTVSTTGQIVGSSSYPEVYTPQKSPALETSYSSLIAKAQNANITPTNLATVCNLTNCTLPANLAHGIYQATGNVNLNAFTFPANQNYIFLINGILTIRGNILINAGSGSTALFSTTGNIVIATNVGVAPAVTTSALDGWYVAGQSFVVNTLANCNDLRLNITGSVIANALGTGGTIQNDRDLCGNDPVDPTLSVTQRLDFILNAPQFLKRQQTVSQEVAP